MKSIKEYSDEELIDLKNLIEEEQERRAFEDFPYKIGDCFINFRHGFTNICRIDSFNSGMIEATLISVNMIKYVSFKDKVRYNYQNFLDEFEDPMDPKIFEVYSENFKALANLRQDFINKIKEMKESYGKSGMPK